MELVSELNLDQLIIKPPIYIKSGGMSEVWYKKDDGTVIKPIFQTPRLKVAYSATKFQNNAHYTYCISLHNADIDEEIECFYNLVNAIDDHIKETLVNRQCSGYTSAMTRKKTGTDYHLRLRLINDGTVIKNTVGKTCCPADILYGMYADQYVGLDVLMYTANGVIPIWNAHQIVLSRVEKVFLSTCLLDVLHPVVDQAERAERAERDTESLNEAARKITAKPPIRQSPLGAISLTDILNIKLKKTV
jgi:hypothetical protein